ncbi:DUF805 domain-containing protein [Psittacicella hinzii]|uniref:DUF805 domain-containing protein n=1 Tax=Psittacicella hinzii TaxID=2028575 RepID=A0A3A1YBC1_9GAMM|nr:DUF805 domain-containing protein [Psittacicella hinzii]RIY34975.1 hypothetical protein CKF58_07305 [Psittacicella hinzii]
MQTPDNYKRANINDVFFRSFAGIFNYTSFQRRRELWLFILWYFLCTFVVLLSMSIFADSQNTTVLEVLGVVYVVLIIAFNLAIISTCARRCRDIGISPYYSIIALFLPLWLVLGFIPSNMHHNPYRTKAFFLEDEITIVNYDDYFNPEFTFRTDANANKSNNASADDEPLSIEKGDHRSKDQ